MGCKEQDTPPAYFHAPVWLAACNTTLCRDPPLSQPGHVKMTMSLSASVKPTPAQTPTPPTQERSGHRRIPANRQDLRLAHGPPPQASHGRMLPPGWGSEGAGILRDGEEHRWPHRALDRAIPPRRPSRRCPGLRLSRNQKLCPGGRCFPLRRSPSGPDPTSQQAPKSPVRAPPSRPSPSQAPAPRPPTQSLAGNSAAQPRNAHAEAASSPRLCAPSVPAASARGRSHVPRRRARRQLQGRPRRRTARAPCGDAPQALPGGIGGGACQERN